MAEATAPAVEENVHDLSHLDLPAPEDTPAPEETPVEAPAPEPEPQPASTPAATTTTEPAAPATPVVHQHPANLRRRAIELGAPPQALDTVSTDDLFAWVEGQISRGPQQTQQQVQPQAEEDPLAKFDFGINPMTNEKYTAADIAGFDPALQKFMRETLKKLDSASNGVKELRDLDQQRVTQSNRDAVDAAFESLGQAFTPIVGKGSLTDLNQGSEEEAARFAIYSAAGIDPLKDSPATKHKKIQTAAKKLYGRFLSKSAPAASPDPYEAGKTKPKLSAEEFAAQAVATPTSREAPIKNAKGNDAAVAAAREWMEARGVKWRDMDTTLEGLPD